MRGEEFGQKFDDGEDVTGDLDLAAIRRSALEQRQLNIDFPSWMIIYGTGFRTAEFLPRCR